jgi:Fe-Mn family superoxide dismutase
MKILIFVIIAVLVVIAFNMFTHAQPVKTAEKAPIPSASRIQTKDFSGLLGMSGFSDTLLGDHFKLYQGYIKNTNAIFEKLDILSSEGKDRTPEYAELKRRLGWEFNGALLHEYYFENLGGKEPLDPGSAFYRKIAADFKSFDDWKKDFISTGMMRGIGWVVLYLEPKTGKLVNSWINEHDTAHIAGATPLLVMDVFEHAYMTDYQLDREKYIDSFFRNINWKTVSARF